jgi:hypothetical protein
LLHYSTFYVKMLFKVLFKFYNNNNVFWQLPRGSLL